MVDYSLISFVLRGERRKAILLCFDKPMIPKEIAEKCEVSIHNVSKSLKELVDKGLIKCENPNDKFYRFYSLTDKGDDSNNNLSKEEISKEKREYRWYLKLVIIIYSLLIIMGLFISRNFSFFLKENFSSGTTLYSIGYYLHNISSNISPMLSMLWILFNVIMLFVFLFRKSDWVLLLFPIILLLFPLWEFMFGLANFAYPIIYLILLILAIILLIKKAK